MTSAGINLSQVKLNIMQIVGNLQQLNSYDGHEEGLEKLKSSTEHLLKKLDSLPLERLKCKLKRRQRKKLKNLHKLNRSSTSAKRQIEAESLVLINLPTSRELKHFDHHSKSIKECKRFLQSFELLEQLHLFRGHNSTDTYKFSLKLRQLKSVWNSLLQDKMQEQASSDVTVQQQWNQVLFGPLEKTYFRDGPDLHDFIRKRKVWDSYLNSKYGSSIPIGWAVPHPEVKEQWRPYLVPTNV